MDPSDDGQWIRLLIGPDIGPGEESFDILVCTPRWLARRVEESGPILGRHMLVMSSLNLSEAVRVLRTAAESVSGEMWRDVVFELAQIGFWEFQDYRANEID
ncbi:immunity 8 family protein [Microbacterium sp. LWO13-1.2]